MVRERRHPGLGSDGALVSAHRGGGEHAPAGTVDAYVAAVTAGAHLVELDVRRSVDGVLFCLHACTVDGVGPTSAATWADIVAARPATPTYVDLLGLLAEDTIVHVDLKELGYEADVVEATVEVLADLGRAVFTTLEEAGVARIRRSHPEALVALSLGRDMQGSGRVATARVRLSELAPFARLARCDATAVAVHYRLFTPALRSYCVRRGLVVMVWTVNDDDRIRRLLANPAVGVVITDRPMAALAIRTAGRRPRGGGR